MGSDDVVMGSDSAAVGSDSMAMCVMCLEEEHHEEHHEGEKECVYNEHHVNVNESRCGDQVEPAASRHNQSKRDKD